MAKKKKLMKLTESRPRTSCYKSPPAILRVGHDPQCYYIPESLLQSLREFASSSSSGTTIDLVDVDAGTGHVFAHFLHTGTYQTLADGTKSTSSAKATTEFRKAVLAYVAAKKYGLTALQELARAEAVQWGEVISIVEAIQAANEDSIMELTEDALWFQDLMLQKADQAFNVDGGISFTTKFLNNIKNAKLAKLLAQHTKNYHLECVSMLQKIVSTLEIEGTAPVKCVVENTWGKPLAAPSAELDNPEVLDASDLADHRAIATPALCTESREPYSPSTAGKILEPEPAFTVEPELGPGELEVLTSDAPGPIVEVVGTAMSRTASAEEVARDIISTAKKERSKEKSCTPWVEEFGLGSPAEAVPEPVTVEDDVRGSITLGVNTFGVKKKKKTKEGGVEEESPPPKPGMELIIEPETEPIQESVSVTVPEAPETDPFAGLSKSQKKKLEKRMKQEAAQIEVPPSTIPLPGPELTAGEYLVMSEPETETDSNPQIKEGFPPGSGFEAKASDDDDCPLRYEHLSRTGVWSGCSPCELYVQKIALNLHPAGLPAFDRLEAR